MFIHIGTGNQILCVFLGFISAMEDPVSVLFKNFPYDTGKILASSCGEAYVALMLANGQIGVCSSLNIPVETDPLSLTRPDLKRMDHRMLVIAYANAHVNYLPSDLGSGDIFDQIDFAGKKNTVMVGYFPPLMEKFRNNGFSVCAFDQLQDHPDLTPISQMEEKLRQADCVVITATTLINSTFLPIMQQIALGADIYMLGPSTPLFPVFRERFKITRLFGMLFKPYDFEVLEIIGKGMGTPAFSKKGKKVSL